MLVVCFDSVMFLVQAKGLATTIRIEEGGDNVAIIEGIGFDSDNEAIVRDACV